MAKMKYRRVLLKVSGEYFIGQQFSLDPLRVKKLAGIIAAMHQEGIQVAIVLGAGNLCRGQALAREGFDQITADHMGMLATMMNALALKDALLQASVGVEVYSALAVTGIVTPYMRDDALSLLDNGYVVICAGGTGNPLVTTDTAAALRAIELNVDILLKATKVDAVYSKDPKKFPDAVRFKRLSYQEVIEKSLEVMDLSAFCLCRDHHMPIHIFNMEMPDIVNHIVRGEEEGTLITEEK